MTEKLPAHRAEATPGAEAAPLRASLFSHLERNKLIRPLGGKDALTPKIGEPPTGGATYS